MSSPAPRPSRRTLVRTGAAVAALGAATLAAPPVTAALIERHRPTTRHWRRFFHDDRWSWFHVWADGLDWTRPVGVLWYLDGDHYADDDSNVLEPRGPLMTALAREANRRNLVLVAVDTPGPYEPGYGYTWWRQRRPNAALFRALAAWFNHRHTVSWTRQWMYGYSGGAELISLELLAHRQTAWMASGGAILLGGGTRPASYSDSWLTDPYRRMPVTWVVSSDDGAGDAYPVAWSAYDAACGGQAFYAARGHTGAELEVLAGLDHEEYDMLAALRRPLDRAGLWRLR